eukprot:1156036-Pelagomonas_calceolata.AAC.5
MCLPVVPSISGPQQDSGTAGRGFDPCTPQRGTCHNFLAAAAAAAATASLPSILLLLRPCQGGVAVQEGRGLIILEAPPLRCTEGGPLGELSKEDQSWTFLGG